jgi:hypothetical protein
VVAWFTTTKKLGAENSLPTLDKVSKRTTLNFHIAMEGVEHTFFSHYFIISFSLLFFNLGGRFATTPYFLKEKR